MRLLFVLLLAILDQVVSDAGFTTPAYGQVTQPGKYGNVAVWTLGGVQEVEIHTDWAQYAIELWQQLIGGGGAQKVRTVYNQTLGEVLPQSFNWTVQTYGTNLEVSPVFFFWLFEGPGENLKSQTSAYFNITDKSQSTSTTSSASSTSTSSSPSSTLKSSTSALSTTTTGSALGATESASSTNTNATTGEGQTSGGLSTGAQAGIGVGVSISGLAAIACASVLFWYTRKKRRAGDPSTQGQFVPSNTTGGTAVHTGGYTEGYTAGSTGTYTEGSTGGHWANAPEMSNASYQNVKYHSNPQELGPQELGGDGPQELWSGPPPHQ